MVEDIIKAVNHSFIYVSKKDIDQMLIDCKEKLLACSQRCSKFEAFFDCKDLSESQLIELIDICEETNTLFLGFKEEKINQSYKIYDKKIYSGDRILIEEDVMILQDIPNDCFIECYGNLIVLGTVKGCIDLYHDSCRIIASSFRNARIRIFDSEFQIVTSFSNCILYYKNNQIIKEANTWDVASVLPQVKVE